MAVHLYGVVRADASLPSGLAGRQDSPARLVGSGGLAAIVSDVDVEASARRKDMLAHAHVLEAAVEQNTVIPVQFGIALAGDEDVRQRLLREQRESLEHLLQTFDGLEQVTVQAFHQAESILREVLLRHPALATARDEARRLAWPASQEKQIELGSGVAAALEGFEEADRLLILDRLSPLAVDLSETPANGEHEVVHAAFLLKRSARTSFDATVGSLRQENENRMRIRYVGPQPPYAFLEAARAGGVAWG